MAKGMSSTEARKALGLTRAQFDYVVRTRPELAPPKVGPIRVWSAGDVERVRKSLAGNPVKETRPTSSDK